MWHNTACNSINLFAYSVHIVCVMCMNDAIKLCSSHWRCCDLESAKWTLTLRALFYNSRTTNKQRMTEDCHLLEWDWRIPEIYRFNAPFTLWPVSAHETNMGILYTSRSTLIKENNVWNYVICTELKSRREGKWSGTDSATHTNTHTHLIRTKIDFLLYCDCC